MHRRPFAALAGLTLVTAMALTACSDEDPASEPTTSSAKETQSPAETSSESPTETPSTGTTIQVTREGDALDPSGARVEAAVGQPIIFEITADTAGELHVHSTPEQEITYEAGTTSHEITIDTPGVVEVESHEPHAVVVQLEVR